MIFKTVYTHTHKTPRTCHFLLSLFSWFHVFSTGLSCFRQLKLFSPLASLPDTTFLVCDSQKVVPQLGLESSLFSSISHLSTQPQVTIKPGAHHPSAEQLSRVSPLGGESYALSQPHQSHLRGALNSACAKPILQTTFRAIWPTDNMHSSSGFSIPTPEVSREFPLARTHIHAKHTLFFFFS